MEEKDGFTYYEVPTRPSTFSIMDDKAASLNLQAYNPSAIFSYLALLSLVRCLKPLRTAFDDISAEKFSVVIRYLVISGSYSVDKSLHVN